MTVPSANNKDIYNGNDATTEFDWTYLVKDESHLVVIHTDVDDVETTLVLNTDYTINSGIDNPNGGEITYPISGSPLATGEKITLVREVPLVQLTDYQDQDGYYPETTEDQFDLTVMMCQQLAEELERCIKVAISSGTDPDDLLADIFTARDEAQAAAAAAAASEAAAAASEAAAAASAAAALVSETNAAASAAAALVSETNAAASEAAAQAAQTAAETAQTGAETAQTAAEAAQTAAEAAQTAAEAAQTAAEAAQIAAEAAQTAAEAAQTAAETAETNAAASAAAALVSETNAAASEAAAAASAQSAQDIADDLTMFSMIPAMFYSKIS